MLHKVWSITKKVYVKKTKNFRLMTEHIPFMYILLSSLTHETVRRVVKTPEN